MSSLYRFVSFPVFVDLVQRRALTFVHFRSWDDPYEGYTLRALETVQGRTEIQAWLSQKQRAAFDHATPDVLRMFCDTVFLQCWTKLRESDALWRIYGADGFGVRIEIKSTDLKALEVQQVAVKYGAPSLTEELKRVFAAPGKIELKEVFASKRSAFEHEHEVRLITSPQLQWLENQNPVPAEILSVMPSLLDQLVAKGDLSEAEKVTAMTKFAEKNSPRPQFHHVDFASQPHFLRSVLVHPRAPDWFRRTVDAFCSAHGVPFLGKSKLYTFERSN
ncbi:MAG: hypothetical protein AB7P37_01610 [Ramlibacter sp.]